MIDPTYSPTVSGGARHRGHVQLSVPVAGAAGRRRCAGV